MTHRVLHRAPSRVIRLIALVTVLASVAAACSGSEPRSPQAVENDVAESTPAPTVDSSSTVADPEPEPTATLEASRALFELRPSVNQLHVLGAVAGETLELVGQSGSVTRGTVDDQGSLLWRDIAPGEYVVRTTDTPSVESEVATVIAIDDIPDRSFYSDQRLDEGFGYVTTRDGTTLSATVWLPGGDGPYPTVVEYSGYSPSDPSAATFAQIYTTMGYAYVGVNIRGTGCSGGSFEFFEPVQNTDGYDMIETIAAQPWVLHNHVGMVGLSYPAIAQLFVAQTQPPSLAAITPLSVLDDATQTTLYPGGLLNTGFALAWSNERQQQSQPYGQGWEQEIVDDGDSTCADNQLLRLQNTNTSELIDETPFYVAELSDPIAPANFVDKIEVPVFLAGAWQDEQTGGHFPAMLDAFTGSPHLYATMVNGSHTEAIANPAIFARYVEFLELYVARRTPNLGGASLVGPILSSTLTGINGLALPNPARFSGMEYEDALAVYEGEDHVRILFEEGAASNQQAGAPLQRFEETFEAWPVAEATATSWYLGPDGFMRTTEVDLARDDTEPSSYVADPDALADTFYEGGADGIWRADVEYDWQPIPDGTGAAWVTEPLAEDTVTIGFGSLDIWLRSTAEDTDLEVTVTEVRPDGQEVYIQTGWLRASHRKLDEAASRGNYPTHTHLEADAQPLSSDEFALTRVQIFPFAHAFRAGSRIRVSVDAPGGARPTWAFDYTLPGGETNEIAHDAEHPSRLVLMVVADIEVPAGVPACGSLRSQPCRTYVPFTSDPT